MRRFVIKRRFKFIIEYDGTHFCGWQTQPNKRTVQGEIQKYLTTIAQQDAVLIGSGRTDSGVHALAQVAHCKLNTDLTFEDIQTSLNTMLDKDVAIVGGGEVDSTFHAQKSAVARSYEYRILNTSIRSPLNHFNMMHYPGQLDTDLMKRAAHLLIGTHDFKAFQNRDASKPHRQENTVRTMFESELLKKGDQILYQVHGSGFLYKMVRRIVGSLIAIGSGKEPFEYFTALIEKPNQTPSPVYLAPASGLTLQEVFY